MLKKTTLLAVGIGLCVLGGNALAGRKGKRPAPRQSTERGFVIHTKASAPAASREILQNY